MTNWYPGRFGPHTSFQLRYQVMKIQELKQQVFFVLAQRDRTLVDLTNHETARVSLKKKTSPSWSNMITSDSYSGPPFTLEANLPISCPSPTISMSSSYCSQRMLE
jgi:hypothetical protein